MRILIRWLFIALSFGKKIGKKNRAGISARPAVSARLCAV
jgi:hypothetical protein